MATTRKRTAKTTTTTTTATAEPPKRRPAPRRRVLGHEDIAARAYAIFESEGGGDHVDHWLRAERELAVPARRRG